MVRQGVTHVVMEVSSHSLALDRVLGTEFDIAVFTNLTHDHLDFHKTMNDYLKAKLKLFSSLLTGSKKEAIGIINKDDPHSKPILDLLKGRALAYGINYNASLSAKHIEHHLSGTSFGLATEKEVLSVRTKLVGTANVYNMLASILCALSLDEDITGVIESVEDFSGAPGRFEAVDAGQPFPVIVDFAHSPDGLQKLLEAYKPLVKGRIILVFGCPGDRDRDKRPVMGKIAAKLADYAIISTDDPHSEDPARIINEIGKGNEKIVDRKKAIEKALSLAKKDDVVLIAGRGHERYQDFAGKKVEIDDREVVRAFFKK
jgi:UDP-N-acetylmuramoyl-L-alanyl-D-glutamate--2,6-diaminopimelate ligase